MRNDRAEPRAERDLEHAGPLDRARQRDERRARIVARCPPSGTTPSRSGRSSARSHSVSTFCTSVGPTVDAALERAGRHERRLRVAAVEPVHERGLLAGDVAVRARRRSGSAIALVAVCASRRRARARASGSRPSRASRTRSPRARRRSRPRARRRRARGAARGSSARCPSSSRARPRCRSRRRPRAARDATAASFVAVGNRAPPLPRSRCVRPRPTCRTRPSAARRTTRRATRASASGAAGAAARPRGALAAGAGLGLVVPHLSCHRILRVDAGDGSADRRSRRRR